MIKSLTTLSVAAALALAGCGDDSSSLAEGDCTDVDPTLVIEAIEPEKVDCDSEDAKSKVSGVEDSNEACGTEAVIEQGDDVYCLEAHGETFRDQLEDAPKPEDIQKELTEGLDGEK